ncbi:P-loop containing nucleoside triphosphate hydrolase [Sesbania bispinosa]|nr:P-loop containing nucleoside triphosphate hydrolase [Sesbania bispinosa]
MDPLTWSWKFLRSSDRLKAWLAEQHMHLKSYKTRLEELENDVKKLVNEIERVHNKVVEETTRYGRGIPDEVKGWINEVNEIISEYQKFVVDKPRHELAKCVDGYLPKNGIRYRLGRQANDIKKKVNELLEKAKFDAFSYWLGPPSMAAFFHNVGYEPIESRDVIMNKINAALENPSVRMIGLHGWSGVGKTTLVKEIAREASKASEAKAKMFHVAVMANHWTSICWGFHLREMLMMGSAVARKQHLGLGSTAARKQWRKFDLRMSKEKEKTRGEQIMANIEKHPSAFDMKESEKVPDVSKMKTNETPGTSSYKGCKVLLISESKQVLLSQMEGKENCIYSLGVLMEKEAEALFKKKAGIGDGTNFEFEKLATQIASKCNGLPMTIITTARALKNQSRSVWEDVHQRLESKTLIAASEFSTKLSYELLENEELKDTFLLCARLGQDALIMDLVKYCIGLGFLEGIYTVREARSRVYALVGRLKVSGLLSYSYPSDHFTMSDIVRSAALSIASKEKHVFTMIKGKVDEWPDKEKLERYTAISLHHCDIIKGFPTSFRCPKLRVLHINNKDPHLEIPNNFFRGMKELRVLILTGINLSPFPSSIRCLTKLRMLCLEQCKLGDQLSIIGQLKNLRILSLSGSDIEKLPVELKHLTMLQILDISNCFKLREIPPKVISSLNSLEELYMRNTTFPWKVKGQTSQTENASLSELRHLSQLTTLDIQIREVSYLQNNLFFDKLTNYSIVVGDLREYLEIDFKMPEKYDESRFLAIQSKRGFDIHSQKGIKMLFETVENLFFEELEDVQDLFYRLNLKGFPCLKHLLIVNNSKIQSLIKPEERQSLIKPEERRDRENRQDRKNQENIFPKLESLYLCNLKVMDNICSCNLSTPSFGKLRVIKINLCGQLMKVFSFSVASLLTVLETIEVSECNALMEIVSMDEEEQSDISKATSLFPELRSLTLQSLSKFIRLYPISSTEGEAAILFDFDEKVFVSKLERMVLSSIQIGRIWSKSLESGFQNLIHLDVNGCWNLEHLISFSMAKCLDNLQSLFVSECVKMTHIFRQEKQGNNAEANIFPKLKNIKLSSMKSLSEIWNSEFTSDSFGKLDTVIIEECDKLVNVFCCYKKGIFQSLCNLRVTNCRSMIAVYDLGDKTPNDGDVINLQDVHLETLPRLEHVWNWNEDQDGMFKLNNLQKILVHDCDNLENIFPLSVARSLHNLEYLVVLDCVGLREIVAEGGVTSSPDPTTFEFPKLTTIKISELPELESFYRGAYELKCPELKDLSIENCARLEPFRKEIFTEEVINKLKSMRIESWHAKSSSGYMGVWNPGRENLEELSLSGLTSTEILYSYLHSHPNLKTLSVHNSSFTEIVPLKMPPEIEKYGVVPKLKSLKLGNLSNLESLGFERDLVLQRIESLSLKNCPSLVNIIPSSVSLTHLTNLEVVNCNGLEKLMSSSAAKSLGQLNTMKVIKCELLEEIVRNEDKNAGEVDIVFRQLKTLELVSLKNLNSFCGSKSCAFEFPSLEKLVVSACPKMENFSEGVMNTPILQGIYVVNEKEKGFSWRGNLKATIKEIFREKKFFEGMHEIKVSEHAELQAAWHGKVDLQNSWFYSLNTLKLYKCKTHPYAIPSNILPYLKSLKELEVRDCNQVKVIFDMNSTEIMETSHKLKNLTLEGLSEVTHVWEKSHQGILRFQNLQQVSVSRCKNLQTLFPATLAIELKKLEKLQISHCRRILEIVKKDEDVAENFVFPCLTSLDLYDLPMLDYFSTETSILECPALSTLFVLYCPKLKVFQSAHPEGEGEGSSTSINRQPLFSNLKAISNLEVLWLDSKHSLVLRPGQIREILKYLNEICLFFELDENEKPTLPFEILEKAPNLQNLRIEQCNGLEIFLTSNPEISERRMLGHLKILTLNKVSKLQSIGLGDSSWLNTVCDYLHVLNVCNCPDLTSLLHSEVSFSYLKVLYIYRCHGLRYLFTFKTAKELRCLEDIIVRECKSMEVIVKQDETASQEIQFERLYCIYLNSLSSLECFYSGNDGTLKFPSLIEVTIIQCPKMETFSQGEILAESFRGIKASLDSNDELVLHIDLKGSVKGVFLQQMFAEGVNEMSFSKYPELRQAWHRVGQPENWFDNLKTLKLDNCDVQPCAIPSNILPYLKSLKELVVRHCNKAKIIFGMNDTEIMETASQLKTLTLEGLSELTHVWENSHGILRFRNLQQVCVSLCENLQTLFPVTLAKSLKKLEKLEIRSCRQVLGIVGKEENAAAHVTEKFVFPCLTSLDLYNLPELTYLYPETFTLECPMLNKLSVISCAELELFQSALPEGKGESSSASTNRQPFFSNVKAISNLKELWLDWQHTSAMLRSGQLTEDLQYLNELCLYRFSEKEDATFPFGILEKAPNLQEIRILRWNSLKTLTQNPKISDHRMFEHLKTLTVDRVPNIESFESTDSSWLNIVCEKLHKLNFCACPDLTKLLNSPSSVSFSCLKELYISECHKLEYLFTSSAARKLMHLEKITVKECESMKEIVAKEQHETSPQEIKFERLYLIHLNSLPSLEYFYSGSDTLQLPSLIQVDIILCPNMENFSQGLIHAEYFRGINVSYDDTDRDIVFYYDVNASVKRVFLQRDHLVFQDSPLLKEIWLKSDKIPDWCFCNLTSLVVEGCEFLSNAILPFHLLRFLQNLQVLRVRECDSVEAIFDHTEMVNMEPASDPFSIPLKKLILEKLPILKHIWNEDPQGSLILPFLEEVSVIGCKSIQSLFPASVAKDCLKILHVENCDGLVEIVAKNEATEEANEELVVFPRMTSLRLRNLPKLRCICPGIHVLEWPVLKELDVLQCQVLKFIASEFQNSPDSQPEAEDSFPTGQQAFVSLKKVTPCLEVLALGMEGAKLIEQGKLHVDLQQLNSLRLQCFYDESDVFPFIFCSKAQLPSIKQLVVVDSAFQEIFPSQTPDNDIDYTKILSQFKGLELQSLSRLKSIIGLKHSWMDPFLKNLETLLVWNCDCLRNLAPSTVSFSNLTELNVKDCHGLEYLFTPKTAKTLGALKTVRVTNCQSIQNVVHDGQDDDGADIILGKLDILNLSSLPKLECFYSGNSTLHLSSLKRVLLTQCHNMEFFCFEYVAPTEELEVMIDGDGFLGNINKVIIRYYDLLRS